MEKSNGKERLLGLTFKYIWPTVGGILLFLTGYGLGVAHWVGLSFWASIRVLDLITWMSGTIFFSALAVLLALKPKKHQRDWTKIDWRLGIVIRLTDQGLWLGFLGVALLLSAEMVSPETLKTVLSGWR